MQLICMKCLPPFLPRPQLIITLQLVSVQQAGMRKLYDVITTRARMGCGGGGGGLKIKLFSCIRHSIFAYIYIYCNLHCIYIYIA